MTLSQQRHEATCAGYVLLAGLPNAGKSTLLNAIVGEHMSIVTPKAQTTWQRVAGIRTDENSQMILLDTPGIIESRDIFHRSMHAEAESAREDADVAVGVVDGAKARASEKLDALFDFLQVMDRPLLLAINKKDHPRFDPAIAQMATERFEAPAFMVSAKSGKGVPELMQAVRSRLPESPFLYPEDDIAVAPTRFFIQEMIRESVFELFREEVPYSIAVKVEEYRRESEITYIAATLYVERKSQKRIVIGKKGDGIKRLGLTARRKAEKLLGSKVYLDLWVRLLPSWRHRRDGLRQLGYTLPAKEE